MTESTKEEEAEVTTPEAAEEQMDQGKEIEEAEQNDTVSDDTEEEKAT